MSLNRELIAGHIKEFRIVNGTLLYIRNEIFRDTYLKRLWLDSGAALLLEGVSRFLRLRGAPLTPQTSAEKAKTRRTQRTLLVTENENLYSQTFR